MTNQDSTADLLAEALRMIEDYLRGNAGAETPVVDYLEPEALASKLDLGLGSDGVAATELVPLLEDYLRYGVRSGHRQFHNQLWGGFDRAGFLGEVVASLANTSMYTYEVAPVATLMELELISKMLSFLGFTGGEGVFCSGGSNANLIATLGARHRAFPEIKDRGAGGDRPVVLVSDQSHYSYLTAAGMLGIGLDNVVKVASDDRGRMLPEELERQIEASRDRGGSPFLVGATAGTTVLGAFDPLPEVAEVCARHGLWLHVDGAWGGPAILSPRHRHLLDGVEAADSFAWDAHKLMGAPLTCTAFLTRHSGILRQISSTRAGDTEYLFHAGDEESYDLGQRSLQCGRRVDALKLWLMWKHHGDAGFAQRVDRLFELAAFAVAEVERRDHLLLAAPLQSLNVCFRYQPAAVDVDAAAADRLQVEIRERMRRSGRALVNYATARGRVAIRLVFANPEVTEADLEKFFDLLDDTAAEVMADQRTVLVP